MGAVSGAAPGDPPPAAYDTALTLTRDTPAVLPRSVWYNTPIILTHACVAPGMGTQGPLELDQYASQRAQLLMTTVRQASREARVHPPILLADNHAKGRREDGEPLLSNGKAWRPSVLHVVSAMGILQSLDDEMKVRGEAG